MFGRVMEWWGRWFWFFWGGDGGFGGGDHLVWFYRISVRGLSSFKIGIVRAFLLGTDFKRNTWTFFGSHPSLYPRTTASFLPSNSASITSPASYVTYFILASTPGANGDDVICNPQYGCGFRS